jgi:uncharacterized protein
MFAAAALAACGPATAASFECTKTVTPREKLICQTPALSRLDDQLAAAYGAARARLSEAGGELLKESQRNWLRYAVTVCPLSVTTAEDRRQLPVACITARYRERLEQLEQAGKRIGPFVFNRIDKFDVDPAPTVPGHAPDFSVEHVAFPQIDNPQSPELAAWNKASWRDLYPNPASCRQNCGDGEGTPEDTSLDYELTFANKSLISVTWRNDNYYHGAAHGQVYSKSLNTLLRPGLPALSAADIFGPGEGWTGKLQKLFRAELAAGHAVNPSANPSTLDMTKFDRIVVTPAHWSFGPEGLTVHFDPLGYYAGNPGAITLSWPALKPLLAPGALVP